MESGGQTSTGSASKSGSGLKPNYILKFTLAGHTKVISSHKMRFLTVKVIIGEHNTVNPLTS
jgi:hypothetical protein